MKKKIKEVQNYFADKLARGLYKVEKIDKFCVSVLVDKVYRFDLWIANGESSFRTYERQTFMEVRFTTAEQKTGYRHAMKHFKAWEDTELREKDLAQLKKLREKYPDVK